MKNKKWSTNISLLIPAILVLSLILVACAQPAPAPAPAAPTAKPAPAPTPAATREKVSLDFWAGPFGGTNYVTLFPLLDVLNKTHPWIRASIIETKGTWDNVLNSGKDPAKKPNILTMTSWDGLFESITGVGKSMEGIKPFAKGDRKVIATVMYQAQLLVTFNPNIKTSKDLIGKRVAGWSKGSGAYATFEEQLLGAWGIKLSDFASYDGLAPEAKVGALKDGLVDAIHLSEPFNPDKPNLMTGSLSDLLSINRPLYNIPVPKDAYERFAPGFTAKGRYLFPWVNIPAGHYNKAWPGGGTVVTDGGFWVYKEMPQDVQYELAKALIEKSDVISATGGQAALMVPSVLVGGLPPDLTEDDIAPGTLRYYKEKGLLAKYWKK